MHKLYTTYLSKMNKIPEGVMTAVIMRMPPMSILKMTDVVHSPDLSPNIEVLRAYKVNKDWDVFVEKFNEQMCNDEETIRAICLLMESLEYNPVAIVCCEKDPNECHRSLIATYLNSLGFESEEI